MNKLLITLMLVSISILSTAQNKDSTELEIWYEVDIPAQYPGGFGAIYEHISSNLKYTKEAKKARIDGKVLVSFVINEEGVLLSDSVRVIEGLGYGLDEEAIRLIKSLPKNWNPARATELDKNVPQRIVIPVLFRKE